MLHCCRAVTQVYNCIGPGKGGVSGGTIESGMNMQVGRYLLPDAPCPLPAP
jgi:hypothetical protein